eukprot:UN28288
MYEKINQSEDISVFREKLKKEINEVPLESLDVKYLLPNVKTEDLNVESLLECDITPSLRKDLWLKFLKGKKSYIVLEKYQQTDLSERTSNNKFMDQYNQNISCMNKFLCKIPNARIQKT